MPNASEYPAKLAYPTVVIANGETASGAIDLQGCTLCGFFVPSAFTGTAVTFQVSTELAGTYVAVMDGEGAAISKTVSTSDYIPVDPADFAGVRFLKLVSGSAEGAARTLTLALRPV